MTCCMVNTVGAVRTLSGAVAGFTAAERVDIVMRQVVAVVGTPVDASRTPAVPVVSRTYLLLVLLLR